MNIDRLWSLEAEAGVIGSVLLSPECLPTIMGILPELESFFKLEHRKIYDVLICLFIARKPIDAISLRTVLKARRELDEVGGVEYIQRILDSTVSAANAEYYATVVRDHYALRKVIGGIDEMRKAVEDGEDIQGIITEIQHIAMSQGAVEQVGYSRLDVAAGVQKICEVQQGIPLGWRDIEYEFHRGDLVIVAGRPSMGKSSFCTCMAESMAQAGYGVLIVSLEMMTTAISARMICRRARVNQRYVTEAVRPRLDRAADELSRLPIYTAHDCYTLPSIAALVHRMKHLHQIDIVIVDYLQLLRDTETRKQDSRNEELAKISRALKQLAMGEDVAMIVAAQLNRQVEMRQDHRPRMSDLRDSGAIEADADYVLLLFRQDYYRPDKEDKDGLCEVITAKAREGGTGVTQLVFLPQFCSFENLSRAE